MGPKGLSQIEEGFGWRGLGDEEMARDIWEKAVKSLEKGRGGRREGGLNKKLSNVGNEGV